MKSLDKYGNEIDLSLLPKKQLKDLRKKIELELHESQLRAITREMEKAVTPTYQPQQRTINSESQFFVGLVLCGLGVVFAGIAMYGNSRFNAGYQSGLGAAQQKIMEAERKAAEATAATEQIKNILGVQP